MDRSINASIVLYKNNLTMLKRVINNFFNTSLNVKLYLIDNSPSDALKILADIDKNRIEYIFNNANLGFGAGHNVAIRKAIENHCDYYLVLNPDIYFNEDVLEKLAYYMQKQSEVGLIAPKTLNPDGSIQYLCKMLPTPFDLFARRFIPTFLKPLFKVQLNQYELKHKDYNQIMEVPALSGCFMFFKTEALKQVGFFDENIFMYTEDFDITRRVGQKYKTIYYPHVVVFHEYAKESYKSLRLLFIHIKSAIYYFNKWGWFFDSDRTHINRECLKQ